MEGYDVQKEVTDKYSLRGRVFNHLREEILAGKYEENEELKETIIGNELGVSRTPVREALRQLELEGLVNIIPNKGAYVTGISDKDIKDIFIIRSYLEGLCAAWACTHITKEQLSGLEEIVYLANFHVEKENYDQILELDNKFHRLLYEACGSKILSRLLSDYHHYAQRVRKKTLADKKRAQQSAEEHAAVVEAIKNQNPEQAQELAHQHITSSIHNMDLMEKEEQSFF